LAELAHEIDAIEQRTAQPARVTNAVDVVARALAGGASARTSVARCDKHCARRVLDRPLPTDDHDRAILERLS
jgi:hypothetical protein